jgi:hypothetical protein
MMVVPIEQQHFDALGAAQYFRRVQAGESSAYDNDPGHAFRRSV